MIKLYKLDIQGKLHYHEAWSIENEIVEHWGEVGTVGETSNHAYKRNGDENSALERVLTRARELGFSEIPAEDHRILIIEYPIENNQAEATLAKQNDVILVLDEILGWTGLGQTDGGNIHSETMEVCCAVVDFDLARRIIAEDLRETQHANYSRIYDEEAEFTHIPRAQS